jgi:hypothetical protein
LQLTFVFMLCNTLTLKKHYQKYIGVARTRRIYVNVEQSVAISPPPPSKTIVFTLLLKSRDDLLVVYIHIALRGD